MLVRLGTKDEHELRGGFPKTADELYKYDAVILDDIEAAFFTQDQLALVKNFVSRRGGGLLMLGGPDSLAAGKYDRTPIGSVLPVYVDAKSAVASPADHEYRLSLTREGWLQPWVRTRKTEPEERERLASMTAFHVLSHVGSIKPAATVLAEVVDEAGAESSGPRHAALRPRPLGGAADRRPVAVGPGAADDKESDLEKSWRQTVRWLVADVPRRVEIDVRPQTDSQDGAVALRVSRERRRVPAAGQCAADDRRHHARRTQARARCRAAATMSRARTRRRTCRGSRARTARALRPRRPMAAEVGEREAGWVAEPPPTNSTTCARIARRSRKSRPKPAAK